MREAASAFISSLVPKCRQPVGHALTQAGSSPTWTRSTHSVHFAILSVRAAYRGTSKGHPVSHILQPMQASGFTSTMPFSYCTMAPGAGHALRRIRAVHALVLAHQPGEVPVRLDLAELDQVPIVGVESGHRLVRAHLRSRHDLQVVPFLARHLAGLAADAGGGVDVLR